MVEYLILIFIYNLQYLKDFFDSRFSQCSPGDGLETPAAPALRGGMASPAFVLCLPRYFYQAMQIVCCKNWLSLFIPRMSL